MFTTATTVFLALSALFLPPQIQASVITPFRIQDDVTINNVKVPVVLGVQSRDGDALLCQSIFDQVMKRVADKIDLSFAYVAEIDNSDEDFGVSCESGFTECAGNVQQLCVHKYEPDRWWQFVMCQNYHGRDSVGSPDIAFKCARSALIDWEDGVDQCIGSDGSGTGAEGVQLLRQNVKAAREAEIDTSCTVVINNTPVCIHDGIWKGCEEGHTVEDFVRQINTEWNKINNAAFGNLFGGIIN